MGFQGEWVVLEVGVTSPQAGVRQGDGTRVQKRERGSECTSGWTSRKAPGTLNAEGAQ